ncbi:hypothetical protein CDAR_191211 [Caerostris darwini]|uniref:Uncharacterized protein n=1 Tax=Caerostris darwini TaxID=1538125 RepID=A0AAV4X296_9ARAC|nr:hypothetical protein CDAR_191211 [Caerostris darwini]
MIEIFRFYSRHLQPNVPYRKLFLYNAQTTYTSNRASSNPMLDVPSSPTFVLQKDQDSSSSALSNGDRLHQVLYWNVQRLAQFVSAQRYHGCFGPRKQQLREKI